MRFLIFNGVVIAALFYLFNVDQTDLQSAADKAHSMIGKAGTAATQVVERTRDFVNRDDTGHDERVERIEPPAAPEPEVETVEAEPAPMPAPKPEPVVKKVEPTPAPPPPAPEFTAGAPRRLDPPAPMEPSVPKPMATRKPTRVASAEAVTPEPEAQFVPERKTQAVDYEAAEGRLPTDDPAVAKRQAEVLNGASSTGTPSTANAKTKGGEYAIAEGETLMTPRERRRELHNLAEDMELLFLDKLSR